MGKRNGTVYLLHFERPLGNPDNPRAQASHYIGWADDLDSRLAEHRSGQGAAITRAAVERGIRFEVVATWKGSRRLERWIKDRKNARRLCPCCAEQHPRGRLVLPELEEADYPQPPAGFCCGGLDSYELAHLHGWRRGRPAPAQEHAHAAHGADDDDLPY